MILLNPIKNDQQYNEALELLAKLANFEGNRKKEAEYNKLLMKIEHYEQNTPLNNILSVPIEINLMSISTVDKKTLSPS